MGSSLSASQAVVLAAVFGIVYLLLDALRFFMAQLGPVKLRRWSGGEGDNGGWFSIPVQQFALLTGAVLQICLAAAVGFTIVSRAGYGLVSATFTAIIFWAAVSIIWKALIALIPESFAASVVKLLVPVSHALALLFWPFIFPLRLILERLDKRHDEADEDEPSDAEVRAYIDVGEEEGILEEGEGKLVQSIVDFGDVLAHELMTPRIDMLAFEVTGSVEELAKLIGESKYSRIPVYEQNIDRIVGIVHIKDVFDAHLRGEPTTVRNLARRAYFVPETKRVAELLREFQLEHLQIAIVVDEYGGTSGIISIEDVMEAIVGDISDEHEDGEESIIEIDRDVYLVNGLVKIDAIDEKLRVNLDGDEYETVAGLIFTQTGRVPKIGEQIRKGGLVLEVEKADRKRIHRVKVWRDPEYSEEEEAARG